MPATVLGDIVERKSSTKDASSSSSLPSFQSDLPSAERGFPRAVHRSKNQSAFARARAQRAEQELSGRDAGKPIIVHSQSATHVSHESAGPVPTKGTESPSFTKVESSSMNVGTTGAKSSSHDEAAWRRDMEKENDALLASMDDAQRAKEREDIISQLGPGVLDLINAARPRNVEPTEAGNTSRPRSALAHHSRSGSGESIPANRALRRLRFSDAPNEVFVYESQPSSPRRILGLLPPPSAGGTSTESELPKASGGPDEAPVSSSGSINEQKSGNTDAKPADEHTPEEIRRRYFPNEPPASQNPSLAWMAPPASITTSTPVTSSSSFRYDLQGRLIPKSLVASLPSHLGLHHHGENPDDAGYTLDELLLLSRSTLPVQRAAMLQVLARVVLRVQTGDAHEGELPLDIIQKCLIVGIEAFGDRASASVRNAGLEVVWAGFAVGFNREPTAVSIMDDTKAFEALPMSYFYEATLFSLTKTALPQASLIKLLEILSALSNSSSTIAEELVDIPGLLDGASKSAFGLDGSTSAIEREISGAPSTLALLSFLKILGSISRKCAQALVPGVSDSFLRNLSTILPSLEDGQSPNPTFLRIVAGIFELYTTLGRYGLGASIASTGQEYMQRLSKVIADTLSLDKSESKELVVTWLALLETWIVCATDPHQTTPDHDILWSQISAWSWDADIFRLHSRLANLPAEGVGRNLDLWAALWRTQAAWLGGCRINESNSGEAQVSKWSDDTNKSWAANGVERIAFERARSILSSRPLLAQPRDVLLSGAKACHSAVLLLEAIRSSIEPYQSSLSDLLDNVVNPDNWNGLSFFRPDELRVWTNMLATISRQLPDSSALKEPILYRILDTLIPGDEILAAKVISDILTNVFQPERFRGFRLPEDLWTKTGGPAKILLPLYQYSLWPQEEFFIAPFVPLSRALKMTTTLRPPGKSVGVTTPSGGIVGIRIPQERPGDWLVAPLDILLRSGSTHSRLFRTLPADWTASESDVARSLLLLLNQRDVSLSPSQLLFTCMKVFMLEHEQTTNSEGGEVYRDIVVEQLMTKLLEPLQSRVTSSDGAALISQDNPPLDEVATSFLGPDQPFYQFYSDFIGLYDSTSFGHKLFGILALVPSSQRYPRDFRRLLWGDYGHALRSIQAEATDMPVIDEEMRQWLWPVEGRQDGEMLSLYVKALLKENVAGFLRLVAVHQVAQCLWPASDSDEKSSALSSKLLSAMLTSRDDNILRDLLYYHQVGEADSSPLLIPPHCYEPIPDVAKARLDWAAKSAGASIRTRFPPT